VYRQYLIAPIKKCLDYRVIKTFFFANIRDVFKGSKGGLAPFMALNHGLYLILG